MVPEESFMNLSLVNARSVLYFWNINAKTLEPNRDVRIKIYSEWGGDEFEIFKRIHKQSWGFSCLQDKVITEFSWLFLMILQWGWLI
jgi:hypothetical protein